MKNNKKKKVLTLSLALAAMLLPAATVSAQGLLGGPSLVDEYWEEQDRSMLSRDGGSGSYSEYEREDGGLTLGGMTQDDPTSPLGSGLIILAAAGAGYALLKKKEEKA